MARDDGSKGLAAVIVAAVKPGAITSQLHVIGYLVQNELKKEYSHPGTGIVYGRGSSTSSPKFGPPEPGKRVVKARTRKITHQASAPGEPPAPDTGQLRARINHQVGRDSVGPFVEVGVNDPRARMLEFGTRHIAPRPAFRTVTARMAHEVGKQFAQTVIDRQRKAAARLPKEIQL